MIFLIVILRNLNSDFISIIFGYVVIEFSTLIAIVEETKEFND